MKKTFKIILSVMMAFIFVTNVSAGEIQTKIDSKETTIVLDKNYTDEIIIASDQVVTIDLNGYTYTGKIKVLGELTIKSSKNGGKVILDKDAIRVGSSEANVAGKFTLESGTIESSSYYGIGCFAGSTIIINGGEVNSLYSAITGNNGTGAVHFEVNGGTLTAQNGPSVYMPTPVDLKITAGTLNGGISARMGKIDISGGVINAVTEGFSNLNEKCGKVYCYEYGGNFFLSDAVYITGGTYTSRVEGETNKLELNITGGTLNSEKGYAVAIYDMGKVEQEMLVNISKEATLNGKKAAYKVLPLDAEELGITEITKGYNNKDLVGKVKSIITGGIYSIALEDKYITDEYVQEMNKDGKYVVAKKEVKVEVPAVNESNGNKETQIGVSSSEELENALKESLEKSDIDACNSNANIEINVEKQEENELDDQTKKDFEKFVSENNSVKITEFFDVTILVKNNVTDEDLGLISETTKKITFKVALTEELLNVEEGYTRTYYILRYHDGKVEKLDASLVGNMLSFESDKFSTYAIAYEDVANETVIENPKTSDSIILDLVVGLMAISGASLVGYKLKKRLS